MVDSRPVTTWAVISDGFTGFYGPLLIFGQAMEDDFYRCWDLRVVLRWAGGILSGKIASVRVRCPGAMRATLAV